MNLIFCNVPEFQAEESARRIEDDIKSILEITKKVGADHVEVVNAVRLGQRKNNSSGNRLLQVQLSNLNTKRTIYLMQRNYIM